MPGRFEILGELDRGTWGELLKAYDPLLDRFLAIRVFSVRALPPRSFRRLPAELKRAARLTHPNLSPIHGHFWEKERLHVLEGLPRGHGLETPSSLADVLVPLCQGLGYAHRLGIVHGLLGPACIRIHEGHVTLGGFVTGLALARGATHEAAKVLEYATYFSPEAIRGERLDERSDIYSLGVLIGQMLTGRPPFAADNLQDLLEMHLFTGPQTDSEVVRRCLQKDPQRRYQTVDEILEGLGAGPLAADPAATSPLLRLGIVSFRYPTAPNIVEEIPLLQAALLDPYDAELQSCLGLTKAQDSPVEAEEHYLRAQELQPYDCKAYFNLGMLSYRQGDFPRAVVQFRKVAALQPGLRGLQHWLGNALFRLGCRDEARIEWEEGLVATPEDSDLSLNLGTLHYLQDRRGDAARLWIQSFEGNPLNALAAFNAGVVRLQEGETDIAQELWDKAVKSDPSLPTTHPNLDQVELCLRDFVG